jgi:general secretion pathway protein A
MYEEFYGLRERPFDLTPNPTYLLMTEKHREALSNVEYGITARKSITLLLGDAGTGKTTVIRTAIARAEAAAQPGPRVWAYLKNPALSRTEFLQFLAATFQLSAEAADSKTRLLDELERQLSGGGCAALVVDEAQSLPYEILEEIRLLANIESDTEKLLPVVLAGQPEFADRLNERGLRQLKQRVALRCVLPPLSLQETAMYIAARIERAGGNPGRLFSRDAVIAVYEHSGGIPRTINVICDNALLTGYADDRRLIDADTVHTVCRDFDLQRRPGLRTADPFESHAQRAQPAPIAGSRSALGHAFSSAAAAGRRALSLRSS